jgi:hypothetical protein
MEPRNTIGVGESQPCGSRHRWTTVDIWTQWVSEFDLRGVLKNQIRIF